MTSLYISNHILIFYRYIPGFQALTAVITRASDVEERRLKYLVGETLINGDLQTCREMADLPSTRALLTDDEISAAMEADYIDPVPHVLTSSENDFDSPSEPHSE